MLLASTSFVATGALEPGRGPVTVTVFDRIERPSPN
jgi:hypothetical protein